ncbi:MAG: erythromycin esterase family protein [Bacteroidota bacterium]
MSAFGFTKGRFTAFGSNIPGTKRIDESPPSDSYKYIFHNSETSAFVIELPRMSDKNLRKWFVLDKKSLQLGSVYQSPTVQYYQLTPLTQYYDYLIYFDETTNSVLL